MRVSQRRKSGSSKVCSELPMSSEFWPLMDFPWKAPATQSNFCRLNARQEQGRKSIHQISLTWKWKWSTGGKSFSLSSVSQGSSPYLNCQEISLFSIVFPVQLNTRIKIYLNLQMANCTDEWDVVCPSQLSKNLHREICWPYLTICSYIFTAYMATIPTSETQM